MGVGGILFTPKLVELRSVFINKRLLHACALPRDRCGDVTTAKVTPHTPPGQAAHIRWE